MARGEIAPEPWATAMVEAGHINPVNGKPSMVALAKAAGLGPATVQRYIGNTDQHSQPDPNTVSKLARALAVPATKVGEWLGTASKVWTPPPGMSALTDGDIAAVEAMIGQLVSAREALHRVSV